MLIFDSNHSKRNCNVLEYRHPVEQVKVLEDESDALVPESGAFCGVEFGNVFPGNIVMA